MMDRSTREAIVTLSAKGLSRREIAKATRVSRNSVLDVLRSGPATSTASGRACQLDAHVEDIRALYALCRDGRGRVNWVRVWEKLRDQWQREGKTLDVSYSTLTWYCRKQGIGVKEKIPAARIVTGPGEEMQHDTSPYVIEIGGKKVRRQCASLVLGYSRMIYVQFYPRFDRFQMKVFLTEAFTFFAGVCVRCVIDNTSIALACGSGARAQMAPEVEAFEERFGFRFMAHEIMHSDRKGKVERPFDFVERNFLVGRTFTDDADLNRQALAWVDQANRRRLRELKASPLELFAAEQPQLQALPAYVPEVYRLWQRGVDSYGRIALHGQKYPAPAKFIDKTLVVRETRERVILLDGSAEVANHPKKVEGSPDTAPPSLGAPRRQASAQSTEEGKLTALGEPVRAYLAALKSARGPRYFWSVRKLWGLLCQYPDTDVVAAVARAMDHRIFDIRRVETILLQSIAETDFQLPLGFDPRGCPESADYQRGAVTPEPNLNNYIPDPPTGGPDAP